MIETTCFKQGSSRVTNANLEPPQESKGLGIAQHPLHSLAVQMEGFTRSPVEQPPFTIGQLRKALPAHCFERSLLRSSAYLAVDLTAMAALLVASQLIPSGWPGWLLWPIYWFFQVPPPTPSGRQSSRRVWKHCWLRASVRVQGAVATGVWVVAHECGHGAFSRWQASATQQQAEHVPVKCHPRPLRFRMHDTLRRPSTTE